MAKIRRINPRIKVNYDFKYGFNDKFSKCTIIDISEDGMLLKVPQIFESGDKIILSFEDEEYKSIEITARVVHTNNNYIGVKYIFDEFEDNSFIKHFIHEIKDKNKFIRY